MLQLRYPYVWLALGWVLVIGVIVGSLLPAPIISEITPPVNDKIEHFSAYFVMMMWFGGLYPRAKHLSVAAALLFLGISLDVLQGVATTTRTFDLFDIAADAVGILAALVLSFSLLEGWCQKLERFTIRSA